MNSPILAALLKQMRAKAVKDFQRMLEALYNELESEPAEVEVEPAPLEGFDNLWLDR